jgi:hypothetical protein
MPIWRLMPAISSADAFASTCAWSSWVSRLAM